MLLEGWQLADAQLDIGAGLPPALEQLGQPGLRQAFGQADAQHGGFAPHLRDGAPRPLDGGQYVAGLVAQRHAGRCQTRAALPGSDEQRHPQLFFQLRDAARQRRLLDVGTGSGTSEMKFFGQGQEVS